MSDEYFSRFGGLWTDRRDASDELDRRIAGGELRAETATLVREWMANGFIVLPAAVDPVLCEALRQDLERACREGDDQILMQNRHSASVMPVPPNADMEEHRIVDIHVVSDLARQVLMSPEVVEILRILFDDDPLLFQSLTFEKGSGQGIHQDTAYVVVDRPMELAASWIALEDVVPGAGELMYIPGSHRLPEYCFSGEFKHWNPERDGSEQHDEWSRLLLTRSADLGLEKTTFLPKQGDVFIWAADLAHGGSPIVHQELTRRSIVGHYCPAGATPHYFSYQPHRGKHRAQRGLVSTQHYDEERLAG